MDYEIAQYTVKTVHIFLPVFLNAVTMLIFQIKRIISSEKWINCLVIYYFFLEKNAKDLGRLDEDKRRKKRGWPHFEIWAWGNWTWKRSIQEPRDWVFLKEYKKSVSFKNTEMRFLPNHFTFQCLFEDFTSE